METQHAGEGAERHGVDHLLLDDHRWAERVAILLWAIAGMSFVAMALSPTRDVIDGVDQWFYDQTFPIKWGPITAMSHGLAFLGSWIFVWPLRVIVSVALYAKKRWVALGAWLLPVLLSEPLIGFLKAAYNRPRPPEGLVAVASAAFPSGHAIAGSVVAISLVIVMVPAGPARRNLEIAAAGFAVLMAGSRVYLGAHWLTDVFGGVALGAACAIGGAALVHRHARSRTNP